MTLAMAGASLQQTFGTLEHRSDFLVRNRSRHNDAAIAIVTDGSLSAEALSAVRRTLDQASTELSLQTLLDSARHDVLSVLAEVRPDAPGLADVWWNPLSMMVVNIGDSSIDLAWIGAVGAILVRDGQPIATAHPHVRQLPMRASHSGEPIEVLDRELTNADAEPELTSEPWQARPGDWLLCYTGALSGIGQQHASLHLEGATDPSRTALEMLHRSMDQRAPAGAIVAVRWS